MSDKIDKATVFKPGDKVMARVLTCCVQSSGAILAYTC